ncbi:NAD(P)-binding protein [Rhodotorula sp. JG-1b]|nr:NAD(P)-binding protein [Rhodotorula sp. JG-1b]
MSIPNSYKTYILAKKPVGEINDETFRLEERQIPELEDGQVLAKTLYLSNDPAQRTWIDPSVVKDRAYGPCPEEGDPMPSSFLGRVVKSRSDKWKEGDWIVSLGSWSEYQVVSGDRSFPARTLEGQSESIALSALGMTTMTAYCGLTEVGLVKPDDTVVISGAAGATGGAAVQIAKKLFGCKRVIGIAGGPEKCAWVKKLGADECLDYRSSTFNEDLVKATDGYVNVYFDNVGGSILNAMFARMARFSRIIACGAISSYNSDEPVDLRNWFNIISMRITVRGFIVSDFMAKWGEAATDVQKAIADGRFLTEGTETKVKSKFEDIPKTWTGLFKGQNQGKLVTELV